jgi:DNA-directed RNA polymerase specialized sigma24 family protein
LKLPAANNHERHEVENALNSFTSEDWDRFRRVARYQVYRLSNLDPMDLLQETVVRFLDGKRNWPKGELFKAVFYNAIRSIADEFRSEEAAKPYVSMAELPLGRDGESVTLDNFGTRATSPEKAVEAQQEIDRVSAHFKDDQDVQAVIYGRMLSLSADEVQADFAMTKDDYHAARKRLERWIDRQID